MTGSVEFESSSYVEWGGSMPGCSLTGEWGGFLFEGAVIQVHDRDGNLLGESVLGRGETKANIHCHFPYEVEVPTDADWYSVCVVGFGPASPKPRQNLTQSGWKTSVAIGGDPPAAATPCDAYIGDKFGPLDDEGRPPPIDAEAEWAHMRSLWEQIVSEGALHGYTIEYSRSSPVGSISGEDGDYRFDVVDGIVVHCRFTSASDTPGSNPCEVLDGTAYSPVDEFYTLIEGFGREQVAVEFDLDAPVPTLIRHDNSITTGEEFTIHLTWFQGKW